MALKIVKGVQYRYAGGGNKDAAYVARFLYEFWGYVINAPATVTTPGGFPGVAYTTLPANTLEGTLVLATGTDGATTVNQSTFDSASAAFTVSMVGKYLVVWDSTTPGVEDGIYKVTGRTSATQLTINVANGGVAHPTTFRPRLTSRSSLKYRVVDIDNIGSLTFTTGQYLVFQMTPSISNAGQANSQVQLIIRTASSGIKTIGLVGSPAGTWNGSAFTDAMTEVTHTSNGQGMFGDSSNTTTAAQISMWGDKDGVVCWFKSSFSSFASFIQFEAPYRMATLAQDPNPLICGAEGLCTLYLSSFSNGYNNFWMQGTDSVTRRHRMLVKCLSGDGNGESGRPTATMSFFGDSRITVSPVLSKTFLSKILIGQVGSPSTQFNLARAIMRYARICPNTLPTWQRVGDAGEWLHVQNGICFPWDNSIVGSNLVPLGY
jgi:hypothetical protein